GIEPAVKPAAAKARKGRIGVLAKSATLGSGKFARLAAQFRKSVEIVEQPCPGLVEQVEAGELQTESSRRLIETYVQPLIDSKVDTLVLGCTHYPFLEPLIRDVAGSAGAVIHPSGPGVAGLAAGAVTRKLVVPEDRPGTEDFFTSGSPEAVRRVVGQLWAARTPVQPLPEYSVSAGA